MLEPSQKLTGTKAPYQHAEDQHAEEPKLYNFETVGDMLYAPHSWN